MDHSGLTEVIKGGGTLTPVNVGIKEGQTNLLHGHHRMRAYRDAGKKMLAFVTEVTEGTGKIHIKSEID